MKPSPETLADQGGLWCAQCLDYIDDDRTLRFHRVIPADVELEFVGGDYSGAWTVPAHSGQCVHDLMGLSHNIVAGFRRLRRLSGDVQRAAAVRLFDSGNLGLAMLLHARLFLDISRKE